MRIERKKPCQKNRFFKCSVVDFVTRVLQQPKRHSMKWDLGFYVGISDINRNKSEKRMWQAERSGPLL